MNDSDTISVSLSGVTTMPFGKAIPSATSRTVPSGVMSAIRLRWVTHAVTHLREVEADAVDVDVAAAVDRHLTPDVIGMCVDQRMKSW